MQAFPTNFKTCGHLYVYGVKRLTSILYRCAVHIKKVTLWFRTLFKNQKGSQTITFKEVVHNVGFAFKGSWRFTCRSFRVMFKSSGTSLRALLLVNMQHSSGNGFWQWCHLRLDTNATKITEDKYQLLILFWTSEKPEIGNITEWIPGSPTIIPESVP